MDLMWADVGEKLSLTKSEMRSIRNTFGDLLGLSVPTKTIPERLLPVISLIARLRVRGLSDREIEQRLKDSRVGDAWPEEVLARMESAATVARPSMPLDGGGPEWTDPAAGTSPSQSTPTTVGISKSQVSESVGTRPDGTLQPTLSGGNPAGVASPGAAEPGGPQPNGPIPMSAGATSAASPTASPPRGQVLPLRPQFQLTPAVEPTLPEETVREMVMDLRREICTHAVEERELLFEMSKILHQLVLEVRDLRYTFILAASRKDRKRGHRNISRLLSG